MAGQQTQQFRSTPSYETPQVNPAASVTTGGYKPTAATVQSGAGALQALGNVFGDFFGNAAKQVEHVGDIIHRENLIQIQRENKALEEQGQIDQKTGKEMNPGFSDRQAYYGAFQTSAADSHAFDMGRKLQGEMNKMPLDGSVNPRDFATEFFKREIGSGTGDRDFDNRLLYSFTRTADSLVAHYDERVARTVETNTTQQIFTDFSNQLNAPEGLSAGQMADYFTRINFVTRGDQAKSDKLVEVMVSNPRNDTQALSVLNALQETGWADRHPESYARISEQALANTNKVKSWQAGQEVQDWQMRAHGLTANPNATVDDWAKLASDAESIDSKHGTGMAPFQMVFHGMQKAATQKAGTNLFLAALRGDLGTHDVHAYANATGTAVSKILDAHMDEGLTALVQGPNSPYTNLRDSVTAGYVNPLASDTAASELAKLLANPSIKDVSHAGIPERLKANLSSALTGTDAATGSRAYKFYNELKTLVGDNDFGRYFDNPQAQAVYWGMKAIAPANGDMTQVFTAIRDNRLDAKDLASSSENGKVNLGRIFGKETKPEEVDAKVRKAMNKNLLSDLGRDGWFSNPDVGMSSEDEAEFRSMVAYQGLLLKKAGNLDLDKAVENAAKVFKNTRLALPGPHGNVIIQADPYGGRGRSADAPLNDDPSHPMSIHKGYGAIYAGFPMRNKLGEDEDPLKTFREDTKALGKKLPGIVPDYGDLYLERPRKDGLMPIRDASMQPIAIRLGQDIAVEGKTNVAYYDPASGTKQYVEATRATPSKVPASPKDAAAFLKDKLPDGVFAVYNESQNLFTLHYGFRLKGTAAVRDQKIKEQADAYKPPVVNQHELELAKKRQANISLQPFGAQ